MVQTIRQIHSLTARETIREVEVGAAVRGLRIDCLDLVAQLGFSGGEVGHSGEQLVDG
jgi:hypothetical protein